MLLILALRVSLLVSTGTLAAADKVVFPGKDWQQASPESVGVDPVKLREAVALMDATFGPEGAKELAIVRNGFLIHKGPGIDNNHNVWSCTKTFTSTVFGLLAADGKCTLDDFAVRHLPDLDDTYPGYARIRLRHLASMSAGYKGEVRGVTKEQPWGEPRYYLNPIAPLFEAGSNVAYNDHEVFLLGAILTRLAGESEKGFFQRRIAGPIGMTPWDWGASGTIGGVELSNAAGTPNSPGVLTTPRQMARFGLLYLNRGNWDGRQLLPASFVDEAVRNQVPGAGRSWFLYTRYGFYWWTNGVMPDGKRPWPDAPPGAYTSHGNGSNFCFVIPEWKMVVVRMGTVPIAPGASLKGDALWNGFFRILAGAVSSP